MSATAALTYNDQELSVFDGTNAARVFLPPGLVKTGRIGDVEKFSHVLSEALALATPKPMHPSTMIVGLPEEQAFIKISEIPHNLKPGELENSLKFEWHNLLPIGPEQVYYAVRMLKEKVKVKTKMPRHFVIAAYPKDVIDTITSVLSLLKITPRKFIPFSFGFAALLQPKSDKAILVVKCEQGQDTTTLVVKNMATQFSATLHAPVTSPLFPKQLNNIVSFYEKTIANGEHHITNIVIMPSPYAEALQQQIQSLSLPSRIIHIQEFIRTKRDDDRHYLIPLLGLLRTKFPLAIIPPQLADAVQSIQQGSIMNLVLFYMAATTAVMVYVSIIFIGSLQINNQNKVKYPPQLVQKIQSEAPQVTADVLALNQQIAKATAAQAGRTNLSRDLDAIYQTADSSHITVSSIALTSSATQTTPSLRIEGKGSSTADVTAFYNKIKTNARYVQNTFDGNQPTNASSGVTFVLTITLPSISGRQL